MAYCALADVQALNPQRTYSATSKPTTTQVGTLIDQIAAEIDAILEAQGYTVPVTTPASFVNFLKAVNAYGAGAMAEAAMFPETTEKGNTPHWKVLQGKYDSWMEKLKDGEVIPASLSDQDGEKVGGNYLDGEVTGDDYPGPVFLISADDKEF